MNYEQKYLKYKEKYISLKNQLGGTDLYDNEEFFFNFNSERQKIINKYNFYDTNSIIPPIRRHIMYKSYGFGLFNELIFRNSKDTNKIKVIMKTGRPQTSIYYDYTIGKCINRMKNYYPNIAYTFLFMNISNRLLTSLKRMETSDISIYNEINREESKDMEDDELVKPTNLQKNCKNDHNSILIENIPNSITFDELLRDKTFIDNVNIESFNILYQIYSLLGNLGSHYTNNNLTLNNILFVKVPDNKYIIIDYERSFDFAKEKKTNLFKMKTHFIPVIINHSEANVECIKDKYIDLSINDTNLSSFDILKNSCSTKCLCETCSIDKAVDNNLCYDKPQNKFKRISNRTTDLQYINLFMIDIIDAVDNPIFKDILDDRFRDSVYDVNSVFSKYAMHFDSDWTNDQSKPKEDKDLFKLYPKDLKLYLDEKLVDMNSYTLSFNQQYKDTVLTKITTTFDCLTFLTDIRYNGNNDIFPGEKVYGTMKISTDFKDPWSFQKV